MRPMESLRIYLARSNLSQRDLAKLLDVHEATVSYWISGKNKPKRTLITRLAKITGIPVTDLL
jgi:transcriptional regulator with XRE-family HTH domain